jgi:predicted hotdog family 3-hydroxylacyl-ACP dehydratase
MEELLISGNELLELIPQRPPMVMIDKFIFSDGTISISGLTVSSTCVFCEKDLLSESGLVENIAQTAAAGVGYECKKDNKIVPIGFIAAIKNLEIFKLPTIGSELRTEVKIVNQVMDVTIINGTVSCEKNVLAQCEMRIFLLPENLKP